MKYVIGIDEVGRGSLAGPVVVAALAVPKNWKSRRKIKDSKALTPLARKKLAGWIGDIGLSYAIARVYPNVIDRINIAKAANLAAHRAFSRLSKDLSLNGASVAAVYLDGGLYIKNKNHQEEYLLNARTVVRGDEKFNAVKLASVVAKVSRDRYMVKLGRTFPVYGFEIHKGYGTKMHRAAVRKHGVSAVHRLTFTRKIRSMK